MYPYFIQLFILIYFFYKNETSSKFSFYKVNSKKLLIANLIFVSIFIGFRESVGGDWYNYLNIYNESKNLDFFLNVYKRYGIYSFFGLTFGNLNIPVNFTNYIYSSIFIYGIYEFIKTDRNPYFSLIIFFPIFLIIVGMGFTRQSAAIGIYLYLISKMKFQPIFDMSLILFSIFLIHISAVFCILPFFCKYIFNKNNYNLIFIVIILIILFSTIFIEQIYFYIQYYIYKDVIYSVGAIPRIILCVIPSIIFFYNFKFFKEKDNFIIWFFSASISIIFFLLIMIKTTNPALDRFAFFLIPFQAYVYKELLENIKNEHILVFVKISLVVIYILIFIFWLKFAIHSKYWLPYMINFFLY